jgi:hypothetical protein
MRYTVIGLDEKATGKLRIAAVLESEHRTMDTEPDRPVVLFERWLTYVDADNPEHAEILAQLVYHYGGIPEPVAAADVQPGYLLLGEDGNAETVAEREDAGEQVLILLEGEVRATAYPRAKTLMVVTAEGA